MHTPSVPRVCACLLRACLMWHFSQIGAESLTDEAWDELFLPLDGPEVWRSVLPPSFEANQAHLWVRKWATMWTEKGSGLTTPVREIFDTVYSFCLASDFSRSHLIPPDEASCSPSTIYSDRKMALSFFFSCSIAHFEPLLRLPLTDIESSGARARHGHRSRAVL
jgi:hypothetical protein